MIIDIILILIIIVLSFLFYRQDKVVKQQIDYTNDLEQTIINNYNSINSTFEKMKEIDQKGGFQSDDEVGQIFSGIRDELINLEKEMKIKDE